MSEQQAIATLGLQTSTNELTTPPGSNTKAENCMFLAPGLIGSRRGQAALGYALPSNGHAGFIYDDTLIVQSGSGTLSRDTGSAFTAYSGTYTPPDASLLRMKGMNAQDSLYFTTTAGVYRLDGVDRTPALAGGPVAFDFSSGAVNATTGGFLDKSSTVAYRVVWGEFDAHGTLILGPPSGRWSVTNSSTTDTYNVSLAFPVPSTATTSQFWRIYRTKQFPVTAVAAGADDEMGLIYEAYFTSAQIAAGTVTFIDTTPDSFRGPPLYTNQNVDGAEQANDPPPFAKDICSFRQRAWYANTRQPQSLTLQILGCGPGQDGWTGVRLNDVLSVDGIAFIASTSEDSAGAPYSYKFKLTTDQPAGANVEATTRSLIKMINVSGQGFRATYMSASGDAPGRFAIEKTNLSAGTFYLSLYPASVSTTTLQRSGFLGAKKVTVTTAVDHGLAVGDKFYLSATVPDANFAKGNYEVTDVVSATQFKYADEGVNTTISTVYTVHRISPAQQLAWAPPPPPSYFDVQSLVRASNVVTVTCDKGHGLWPDQYVAIEPVDQPDANFPAGTYKVTQVVNSLVFRLDWAGSNATSITDYRSGARVVSDPYGGIAGPDFISYSKLQQPEAVPAINFIPVGTRGNPILRIAPLGDNLFVFKPEGIYVVSGSSPPFNVDLLDDTVHLYAPDSVVSVAGRLYALTNQGVVAVTSGGAQIVSSPIEQELFQYFGPSLADVRVDAFGVSHETDRLYSLWLPALDGATEPPYDSPRAYVYSTLARAWTTWELERSWGVVRGSDDALFMGAYEGTTAYKGRNTKTSEDFADSEKSLLIVAWDAQTLALTVANASGVSVGDAIVRDPTSISPAFDPAIVTAVNGSNLTLSRVVPIDPGYATGAIYVGAYAAGVVGAYVGGYPYSAPVSQDVGAYINGYLSSWAWNYSDDLTAWYVYNAINMNPSLLGVVTASVAGSVITVTAVTEGSVGNFITLGEYASANTGVTVSGPTLSGGNDVKTFATGSVDIASSGGGSKGVYVNGNLVSVPYHTNATTTAADLTAAINANPTVSALVSAVQATRHVLLTAVTAGAGGNSISLGTYGSGVGVSGPYLTGGSDGAKATGTITLSNARGISLAQGIEALATLINNTSPLVSASVVGLNVNLTARTGGVAGNSITLSGIGLIDGVSASTLTGGVDSYVSALAAIPISLKWRTFVAGTPADEKQWQRIHVHFRERNFYKGTLTLTTDEVTAEQAVDLYPGQTTASESPPAFTANPDIYPGMPVEPKQSRLDVPSEMARGSYLNVEWGIREAFALWPINGLTLVYKNISPKGAQT